MTLSVFNNNNTTPLSYITPHSPMASLHVSSDLTTLAFCCNLLLLVCFTIATILPSHSKKKRTRQSINNKNHGQQTEQECLDISTTPIPAHQSVFTAAWYLLSILVCLIPMASLFNPNRKRIRIRRSYTKRIRQKYPMARPPGTRSKHGKNNTTWNIVYDQRNDTMLVWTNHRVRIYQRRGRRLFTYKKGKNENTFPRHALPISGEWQGSYFIVNYIAHWTNPPTESLPQQCVTPISVTKRNNTQMENHQETAMRPPSKTRKLKTDRPRKQTTPKRKSKKVATKHGDPKYDNFSIGHHTTWTSIWPFHKWRWNGL